jgi:hypothetical protein
MPVSPLALGLTAVAFADDGDFLACTVPKDSMRCDRAGLNAPTVVELRGHPVHRGTKIGWCWDGGLIATLHTTHADLAAGRLSRPCGATPRLARGIQPKLRPQLTPEQGYEAFQHHQLLTIRFVRAALTNAVGRDVGLRASWCTFFAEHFPRGDEHAVRLWDYWRTTLCKDEMPGSGVVVSHGQPHGHWKLVDPGQRLYVNLESMWDDYYDSVNPLIEALKQDRARLDETLTWWNGRRWTVQQFGWTPVLMTASASASAIELSQVRDVVP